MTHLGCLCLLVTLLDACFDFIAGFDLLEQPRGIVLMDILEAECVLLHDGRGQQGRVSPPVQQLVDQP